MANGIKKQNKKTGIFSPKNKKSKQQEEHISSLKYNQQAIIHNNTPFMIQEAYKTARTNIIFSVAGNNSAGCKVIGFTSANPGEGKTTTCINMSITFAQTGARVLIIDGDLRNPSVHQYLGVVKTDGLSTVLSMQKTFEDVVYHNLRPGLDLLTSGSIPPNPAELLSSEAMEELLKELIPQYDYIFIDTPPTTVVTDAAALSKFLDGMVVVVREGYTTHESLDHAINLLSIGDAKILGFFVNDVDPSNANYGAYQRRYGKRYGDSKYGYRYSYRYGRRYSYRYGRGYDYHYNDKGDITYGEKPEMPVVDVNASADNVDVAQTYDATESTENAQAYDTTEITENTPDYDTAEIVENTQPYDAVESTVNPDVTDLNS